VTFGSSDVVVIGGGISGTAAAYELARSGVRVTLLERGTLAGMASGWTLAGVRQSGRHPAELPLATAAVARWAHLSEELDADVQYRRHGNLRLARTEAEAPIIQAIVAEQRALGLDLTFLPDNRTIREVAPAIAGTVHAASFCPTDGHANPNATVNAFAAAAERHGARIRTGVTLTGIDTNGGRVTGVTTDAGKIVADAVVVAAGVYSRPLCAPLGIDLPIEIAHVSVVQTAPLPPLIEQVLGVATADFAGRQKVDGRFRFTGGGVPWPHDLAALRQGYDAVLPPAAAIGEAISRATEVLPALAAASVASVWGGLIDMNPDALPIIQHGPGVEGLVIAAGFSGHGFCLGPVTGAIARDLVVSGRTDFPIEPFRGDRFGATLQQETATLHG
jgi:sarcosine oxidase subunit beta